MQLYDIDAEKINDYLRAALLCEFRWRMGDVYVSLPSLRGLAIVEVLINEPIDAVVREAATMRDIAESCMGFVRGALLSPNTTYLVRVWPHIHTGYVPLPTGPEGGTSQLELELRFHARLYVVERDSNTTQTGADAA